MIFIHILAPSRAAGAHGQLLQGIPAAGVYTAGLSTNLTFILQTISSHLHLKIPSVFSLFI